MFVYNALQAVIIFRGAIAADLPSLSPLFAINLVKGVDRASGLCDTPIRQGKLATS